MSKIDTGMHYPLAICELPSGWLVAYAHEVCDEVQSGFACGRHSDDNIGVAHLRPMNISIAGKIDLGEVKFVHADVDKRRLTERDVLFNNTNSPELIGKTALVGSHAQGLAFSNHMTRVRFNPAVVPEFGAYQLHYLWMARYYLHRCVKHVNQASISSRDFARSIPVIVPPVAEQKRIVAKIEKLFSELDKGIESLKTAQAQLKVYRQAVLKHAFEGKLTAQWREENKDKLETPEQLLARIKQERKVRYEQQLQEWKAAVKEWEESGKPGKKPSKPRKVNELPPLIEAELAELPEGWSWLTIEGLLSLEKQGMTTGPFGTLLKKSEHRDRGIPVLGIENIGAGYFISGNKIFVTEKKALELDHFRVEENDIIISRSGTVGEICKVPAGLGEAFLSTNLIRVSLNENVIDSNYFVYLFQGGGSVKDQVRELCKGSTREFLNQTILSSIRFSVPPLSEQRQIVAEIEIRLSVVDQLETDIEESLQETEALRQSILKKAFTGQLVPQDPRDEPASVLLDRIRAEREKAVKNNHARKIKKRKTRA